MGAQTDMIIEIDGPKQERDFIESGKDLGWLAQFLKKYPLAHYLSWVQEELARQFCNNQWDMVEKLKPGRGHPSETELYKGFVDFLIYQQIDILLKQGHKLTGENGAIGQMATNGIKVGGKTLLTLGEEQIKARYYRFRNLETIKIIDSGRIIISPIVIEVGPKEKALRIIGTLTLKEVPG